VEKVYLDYPIELINPVSSNPAESAPGSAEPGLRDINANKLWEIGITGSNVIVMNLDTGVDGAHPALASRWRGTVGGVDPHWAWFNPDNPNQTFPVDFDIHGTHTMGTLTGLAPATEIPSVSQSVPTGLRPPGTTQLLTSSSAMPSPDLTGAPILMETLTPWTMSRLSSATHGVLEFSLDNPPATTPSGKRSTIAKQQELL
jgi:subtilisin family serine protease